MKNIGIFFLLLFICQSVFGQGEIDTQEKILFQNERSISLSLNTNGFGAGFRFGKRKTYLNKALYNIEVAYIKHPKEVKVSTEYSAYATSRRYVFGKTNIFVNFRPSIGFQHEMFSKEDKGSIAIKYYYGIGPSLGFCKPIYYTFALTERDPLTGQEIIVDYTDKTFGFTQQNAYLLGRASFWKGFDGITFYPGAHVHAGLSFEYSSVNRLINALDVSASFDAFAKKIPIMLTKENNQFFFALSVIYRFGWVVDAKYKTPKITKEGKLQNK